VPEWLDWEQWIGPAQMRPFKDGVYLPLIYRGVRVGIWRAWYDFGTGALGDMACHMVNMPFRALKMGYPNAVECEASSDLHPETFPKTSRIRFEFPAREGLAPLKFWWYDGNPDEPGLPPMRPPTEVTKEITDMYGKLPRGGVLMVGDKGNLFSGNDYGEKCMLMMKGENIYTAMEKHEAANAVPQTIPRIPGSDPYQVRHVQEWFQGMRNGTPTYSRFAIASELTEINLLGCVAFRIGIGKKMEWDAKNVKSPNCPEAAQFLKPAYRKGWKA
jgi:hypothetical protein